MLKNRKFLAAQLKYFYLLVHYILSHKPGSLLQKGNGLVNCLYKPCPAALYSVIQSHCSVLSHDALHDFLSSNNSLENGEGELGHLSTTAEAVKALRLYFSGSMPTP